ncbi:PspC domain-containing protein [Pedobacter faecalis]|uniref:PspC domain-containing protein n=1 Tax=Pedobacter faecalis TaxID=3041495 RepID=UPI002551408B|nr:PspC domain-containing protein [Pedobacter sp. ELA7]
MDRRLFRNEHEKVIAGVSSGIAEYMEVDVTIIRLLFVLSTIFLVGTGILVYLVMWIVVPVNNDPLRRFTRFNEFYQGKDTFNSPNAFTQPHQSSQQPFTSPGTNETFQADPKGGDFKPLQKNNETGRMVGGLFLLVIGVYFLLNEFNIIPFWFSISKLWPLVFVAIGVSFILKANKKNAWEQWKREQERDIYTDIRNSKTNETSAGGAQDGSATDGSAQTEGGDRFTQKDI